MMTGSETDFQDTEIEDISNVLLSHDAVPTNEKRTKRDWCKKKNTIIRNRGTLGALTKLLTIKRTVLW